MNTPVVTPCDDVIMVRVLRLLRNSAETDGLEEPPLLGAVLDDLEAALGEFSDPAAEEIAGLEVRLSRAFDRFLTIAEQIHPPMSPELVARVHRLIEETASSGDAHGLGYVRRLALTVEDLLGHCCLGYPPSRGP